MKVSFDGLRRNLARSYNELFRAIHEPYDEQIEELQKENIAEALQDLRQMIAVLLCVYDDDDKEDMNCLIDEIELLNFEPDEEV